MSLPTANITSSFEGVDELPAKLRFMASVYGDGDVLTVSLTTPTARDLARVVERGLSAEQEALRARLETAESALADAEDRVARMTRVLRRIDAVLLAVLVVTLLLKVFFPDLAGVWWL